MVELRALVFDVDGTLADTERDGHRVAFNSAFEEAGLDWNWSVERYGDLLAVTGGKERIRYFLERFNPGFRAPDDLGGLIADLHGRKTRHYTRMLDRGAIPLRPGVLRLIQEARKAGLRLAIATTTTPANVSALLRNAMDASAESWFDVIAAGDIVPEKKPAPDIFLWAMDRMGLEPDECMAFEDSANGVLAARRAGIRSILVTVSDYTRDDEFPGASLVLDQLGEEGRPARVLAGWDALQGAVGVEDLRALHAAVHAVPEAVA